MRCCIEIYHRTNLAVNINMNSINIFILHISSGNMEKLFPLKKYVIKRILNNFFNINCSEIYICSQNSS